MDVDWASDRIRRYIEAFEEIDRPHSGTDFISQLPYLNQRLPTVVRICEAVAEDTICERDQHLTGHPPQAMHSYFYFVYECANRALGIFADWREIAQALRPDAPTLVADQFHEWVWESARPSWESGLYRAAVHHAASSVNEQLQRKLGRSDISDDKIIQEAFGEKEPPAGGKRLRVQEQTAAQTTASIQRGALQLGLAAFWFVRNPAAHETQEWDRQKALECLALLSQLAHTADLAEIQEGPKAAID